MSGKKLCTPEDTCDACEDLPKEKWDRLLRTRSKREWRQRRRDAGEGDDDEGGDDEFDLDDSFGLTQKEDSASQLSRESDGHVDIILSESDRDSDDCEDNIEPTQAEKETKRVESPSRIAAEIELPDLLRFVSMNSAFSTGEPASSRANTPFRLSSQGALEEKASPFVALSMSPAIVSLAESRAADAHESPQAHVLGFIPSLNTRGAIKAYQSSSPELQMSAAAQCDEGSQDCAEVVALVCP